MRNYILQWWKNYKYRFVPWIALNVKPQQVNRTTTTATTIEKKTGSVPSEDKNNVPVHYMKRSEDKLMSDGQLTTILIDFFLKCENARKLQGSDLNPEEISLLNQNIMKDHFGFTVKRCKSTVSSNAGTGVFVTSGVAKKGQVVALYCGTLYMPSEPLFFPSLGNPFIFRCADGIHIDGNDKWLSKSIYKSCAGRDKFGLDIPCCDLSWLTKFPINPLNVGQYVNNQSHQLKNNVVYQECYLTLSFESPLLSSELDDSSVKLSKEFVDIQEEEDDVSSSSSKQLDRSLKTSRFIEIESSLSLETTRFMDTKGSGSKLLDSSLKGSRFTTTGGGDGGVEYFGLDRSINKERKNLSSSGAIKCSIPEVNLDGLRENGQKIPPPPRKFEENSRESDRKGLFFTESRSNKLLPHPDLPRPPQYDARNHLPLPLGDRGLDFDRRTSCKNQFECRRGSFGFVESRSPSYPVCLSKYLPNVWCDPVNRPFSLKVVPLVAVRDIPTGEEILSAYFTVVDNTEN